MYTVLLHVTWYRLLFTSMAVITYAREKKGSDIKILK